MRPPTRIKSRSRPKNEEVGLKETSSNRLLQELVMKLLSDNELEIERNLVNSLTYGFELGTKDTQS